MDKTKADNIFGSLINTDTPKNHELASTDNKYVLERPGFFSDWAKIITPDNFLAIKITHRLLC